MRTRTLLVLPAVTVLLLSSCRDPKIRTYRIAKETPSPHSASDMAGKVGMGGPNTPASAIPVPTVHWQKPDAWQEQPGKTMRIGSFLIGVTDNIKTELAVTTFPGDVGGDFANVNRWRGQIHLTPITEAELSTAITSIDLPAGKFQLVDLTSTEPLLDGKYKARILGAWLKQTDRTWFFKMNGDADTVGAQREIFLTFLRSVEFSAPTATPATAPAITEPVATVPMPPTPPPDMMSAPVPPPPASENGLTWTAPADWAPKPLGSMRKGSFAVRTTDGAEADLSITMLSAASNPLLENINRWRRQIGLGPISAADLPTQTTTIESGDFKFTVLDCANNATHVVGAILYLSDEAWFFKLSGPDAVVTSQKTAFLAFLKTVKTR